MSKQERKDKSQTSRVRISVTDDDSHEALFSFRTGKGNAIMAACAIVLIIMGISYCLFAFTGLRHAIPGYPSEQTRMTAVENALKIDSLEKVIDLWAFQMENIQRVATGRAPLTIDSIASKKGVAELSDEQKACFAQGDSLLREKVKLEEMSERKSKTGPVQIDGLHFYPPVKGLVTEGFNKLTNHPYIEVAVPGNTTVCAVLDGTVVDSEWSEKGGYTIRIQHPDDLISIYRHNEKLLKKSGDKVSAGTPVAIVENANELSNNSNLQFELWHKGEAGDPARYISFQ